MQSRNNLSTKIIMMVECILLISSTLFCAVSVYRSRVGIRKSIQQRMLDIANCASGSVNGDVLKTLNEDTIGSAEYNHVYDTLAVFRDNVELEYVYSIKEETPGNFIFTMDLDQVSPASYGDSVEYTDALALAGKGTAAVDEVPYTDQWGEFYSAYSPVFDSSGNVAGIVAVDFSVEWFEEQLSSQTRSTVGSYVVILFFTLLVAAILSMSTVRPFVRMQGELLEEKVRAESANLAKSDFLANMSHEIRTPINAVLGMNEMILREDRRAQELADDDAAGMREALENIGTYSGDVKKAGHNLLAIVNDILDFSKIEAGRLDIMEAPYQLSSLLNDLNNMILFKAQDKALDFSIEVDKTLPHELCGDEMRIRQILTNLLNNAVKYTEAGAVKLIFGGEKKEDGMLDLKVAVSDTGIGIRSEDLEKLFTKFERLEMEHNSTVEGTGLGLAITQSLLEMMHGRIEVQSEYGKGTTFTVTIPQEIVSEVPLGDFQAHFEENMLEAKPYRESFRAPQAHLLIVDDTRINLTVVVNLLKNTKIKIDTSTSGAGAVERAEKTKYDLILMDQRMPEMDGTQTLHLIRATEGGASQNVPVICLTADAVIGAKERYISQGFSDYLTKPIDIAALEKMLIKHLPPEKVELVQEPAENASSFGAGASADGASAYGSETNEASTNPSMGSASQDDFSVLRSAGIDPNTGLHYCQNDEAFYRSLLAEYAHVKTEKSENLRKNLQAGNWHDYAIDVHALKSTSKMLGALSLSDKAARLEAAANADDGDTVRAGHDAMMEEYETVAKAILSVIPNETASSENDVMEFSSEDDDVIEFLPSSD
ncbi:MAG: response regulator [Clostridiales bacterium]|nr:response regulator [Clostridiales bacterium]